MLSGSHARSGGHKCIVHVTGVPIAESQAIIFGLMAKGQQQRLPTEMYRRYSALQYD
jgi:hypothetical protein